MGELNHIEHVTTKELTWKEKILNNMPKGWVDAFGDLLCEELSKAVDKLNDNGFDILEVKEKFGSLRIYCGGTTSTEINDIITKYEYISKYVCCQCGKPDVRMVDVGYSIPCCDSCYYKLYYKDLLYAESAIKHPALTPNYMTIHKYFGGHWKEEHVDISETVKKIRERYAERIKKAEE